MMLFPSFIKHFCTLRQTVVFTWCISTIYCMYVALFYIKKKIEDVLIFNISLFTALLLEEISTHFSCEKITESSDRFFSNYSLLGLTLNFFAYLHSCTIFQLNFSFVLVGWYASRVWKWDQNWISFPAIVSMTIHGYCTTTVWPVKTNLHPLDT